MVQDKVPGEVIDIEGKQETKYKPSISNDMKLCLICIKIMISSYLYMNENKDCKV